MEFPVDVLEATSHGELERSARSYMNKLLYADPDHAHYFTLPNGKKVQISLSSVGFVPLYGANLQHKVLALFTPQDQLTAVALFLASHWYSVEDILQTANPRREGLMKVRSVGERIVLYMLNRIVYRTKEMGNGEMPFLCHSENDYAKILWKNGQAVGFYSVKPKGSVCNNSFRQCYVLPVMDSIFVRKAYRGKGYGLQMLEDFVDSFNEDELGLKYPLSPVMINVCRHYLDRYPADVDLFWEVEGVGGPYQRTRVAYKLTCRPLNDFHKGGEDNEKNGATVENKAEESEDTSLNITEDVIVINKHHKITEDIDPPISMRTRSSEHRRRKRVRDEGEPKGVDSQPEKINRMEMAEDEKREFIPADDVVVESMPKALTKTLAIEVNGNQTEEKKKVKDIADEQNESAIQNGTGGEGEEEMEVEKEAEEHKAPVQKTVDSAEESALGHQEVAPVAEDKHELDPIAHLQLKVKDAPAAEKEMIAENEQKEVDSQVACAGHAEQNVAPAAEEKQEVAPVPEAKQEIASAIEEEEVTSTAEEQQEEVLAANRKQEGVPVAEEEQEGFLAAEEEQEVAPAAEEKREGAPADKMKQDKAVVAVKGQDGAPSVEEKQEVIPAAQEEQEVTPESENNEVTPDAEKQEVDCLAEEVSFSLASDAEEEQGPEEAKDVVNDIKIPDIFEPSFEEEERQHSDEKENSTLMVEEEEDEMEEAEDGKNVNEASDFSRVLRGARIKAVPQTSKRTSKRLSKMMLEDDEEEQGEEVGVEEDKGMSTEEEKVTTEEEEHSSEEEEHVQDPPVINKRVARGGKTKVIPTKQRTRCKRRGKM